MTQPPSTSRHPGHRVTAVLVCHDGQSWLPETLAAIAAQDRAPNAVIVVDTGSTDDSLTLTTAALGADAVVALPRGTSLGNAIQAGLDAVCARSGAAPGQSEDAAGGPVPEPDGGLDDGPDEGVTAGTEPDTAHDAEHDAAHDAEHDAEHAGAPLRDWVWVLHDDCAPDPEALDELLVRVTQSPSVWLLGPKVRGWDGARLLEAGLTIDATGHVDTGIDGRELDQGQRDDVDEVLAVGTAGALIRRDVWDRLGGLDPAWSSYADDVDLGWRVNSAGGRVVVASRATVRHAGASSRGKRAVAGPGETSIAQRRRSGMQVVLSNTAAWLVPLLLLRYLVGGLVRALGLLVVSRRPARAWAEMVSVAAVFAHPMVVVTARRARAKQRAVSHRELHRLFPPSGRRWRSSPFRVGRRGDRAVAARRAGAAESGPVSAEAESLALDDSAVVGFFRRPLTLLVVAMSVVALIADRHLFSTTLHGGRLLPPPSGAGDLWSTYLATWHPSSVGSVTPAPPSLAILALLSTVAIGKVWLAVGVVVLAAVPLAALSAYTAARALTAGPRVRVWVAVVYSLLPAVTGAVAGGRIDVLAVAIVLPQVIRVGVAALRADRGWHLAAAAGLLLAVVVAFAPVLWLVAVAALLIGLAFMVMELGTSVLTVRRMVAVPIVLVVPLLVLVPWTWYVVAHPSLLLAGSGLPEFYTSRQPPAGVPLVLLRAGGPAQPALWVAIPVIAAAVLGLTRRSRLALARTGAALLVGGVALAVGVTRGAGVTPGLPASRHWPGVMLLVAGAGALIAVLVAATGARPALRGQSFGWRQLSAFVLAVLAVVATVALAGGWMLRGAGGPLTGANPRELPLFVQSEIALTPTSPRALVLNATGPYITYAMVRRPDGPQLGDADTAPTGATVAGAHLAAAVRDLVAGRAGAGAELAPFGITYVVAPANSAPRVRSALGRAATLTIVPAPGATVWRSSIRAGELTVWDGAAARTALAGGVPTRPAAAVLPAAPGAADVTYPGASGPALAVLAEPADSHWQATLDGTRLEPRTAYGWAQAFALPAGGGRLHISFVDSTRHRWLVVELVLVVVVLLASLPGRRTDDLEESA